MSDKSTLHRNYARLRPWPLVLALAFTLAPAPPAEAENFVGFCARRVLRVSRRQRFFWDASIRGVDAAERSQLEWLKRRPRRDILAIPEVSSFLEAHPVYVSLTTSPERIKHIHRVLESIDATHVKNIFLVLPERFGRDGAAYEIPDRLRYFPKLKIVRIENDLGPVTKLIPAARLAWAEDREARVITIDDDIAYPLGMVDELIAQSVLTPGAVVGGAGAGFQSWHLVGLPSEAKPPFRKDGVQYTAVDVVEGYAGIIYPVGLLPLDRIEAYARLSVDCLFSDDLVISLSLRQQGVPRFEIHSRYFTRDDLVQLPYGFGKDALHRGAGLPRALHGAPENNNTKYARAFATLLRETDLRL